MQQQHRATSAAVKATIRTPPLLPLLCCHPKGVMRNVPASETRANMAAAMQQPGCGKQLQVQFRFIGGGTHRAILRTPPPWILPAAFHAASAGAGAAAAAVMCAGCDARCAGVSGVQWRLLSSAHGEGLAHRHAACVSSVSATAYGRKSSTAVPTGRFMSHGPHSGESETEWQRGRGISWREKPPECCAWAKSSAAVQTSRLAVS
jgi:hypothetical protein